MLQDDFYTIRTMNTEGASVKVILELNAGHSIFTGHFPGQPVVPGVCMMQMVQELIEKVTGRSVQLLKADSMKFLTVIDPGINKVLQIDVSYQVVEADIINVTANISADAAVCFKFKGSFKPAVYF